MQASTEYSESRLGHLLAEIIRGGTVLLPDGSSVTTIDATTGIAYDAAGRLIRTVAGAKTVTYEYNAAGGLIAWADGSASGAITLDELQRKTAETVRYGTASATISHTYRYRYGAQGTKSALMYPDGTEVQYTHDANRQLTEIRLPQGAIATTYRNAYTQIETLYPGGTRSTTRLDALLRVAALDVKGPTQQTLMSYGYAFDAAGNITDQHTQAGSHRFGYDALYRLTQASYGHGLPAEAYTYDKVHNRLTDRTQPGAWTYNANNQLIQQGSAATWRYDANGQAIQKQAGAGVGTAARSYVYNPENRLAEVLEGGSTLAKYAYDPFGRRISKEVTSGGATTTTYYLYADEGLLAQLDASGAITTQYGWAPDGLWGTNPIYRLDKAGGANTLLVYHTDHLGTPQQMTDGAGRVVWSQRQKAFGEMVVETAATVTNNLRFPGQYFDAETGSHYNYWRDLDPSTGRYVQVEPLGLAGGISLYGYAHGNPLYYLDRDG